MNAATPIDALVGPSTFATPGASPDTPIELYGAALTKHLKRALVRAFPGVAFRVRRHTGTASAWAGVSWIDGPTYADVRAIAFRYQVVSFDGMDDGYHSTGNRAWQDAAGAWVVGKSHGINCGRTISEPLARAAATAAATFYCIPEPTGLYRQGDWGTQYPWPQDTGRRDTWQDLLYRAVDGKSAEQIRAVAA